MTEKEQITQQIKLLQTKLNFLDEIEKHKDQEVREAFKDFYGQYPPTAPGIHTTHDLRWTYFKAGYEAAQLKDVEVDKRDNTPPPKPITLKNIIQEWFGECGDYQYLPYNELMDIIEKEWLIPEKWELKNIDWEKGWINVLMQKLK